MATKKAKAVLGPMIQQKVLKTCWVTEKCEELLSHYFEYISIKVADKL